MPSNLLKYVPAHTYEEPLFYQGFGTDLIRANYPKLPIGYTKVNAIQMTNSIPLGVIPDGSDNDLYIYLGFKIISVSLQYSSVITTTYVDEQTSIVRIITSGTSTTSLYTNLFNTPANSNSMYCNNIAHVLMQKENSSRFYYYNPSVSKTNYNTFSEFTPSELKLTTNTNNSLTLNLYGLFIRQNGTVLHNWVPCKRNSDNKPGFYNAVNGEFITNESMVVVNS